MQVGQQESIRSILAALEDASKEDEELVGIDVLIDIAQNSAEGQAFLGECGACRILTNLLSSPRNKTEKDATLILTVIWRMCRRELAKSTSNYKNIEMFVEAGFIDALHIVFKANLDSISATEAACWCIMIFASDNEDNQVGMGNAGVADTLLECVNKYATNDAIIEIICRALRNMSSNMSIAAFLVAEGIADPITGTVVIHTSNPVQLEAALWVVVNLTYNADIASVLGGSGICVATTDVLRSNLENSSVVYAACWAIRNLSCGSKFNYCQFVHTDVCELMVQVLQRYPEDSSITSTALWALANLSVDSSMSAKTGSEQVNVETVMGAVKRHLFGEELDLEVLEAGMWALQNLASGSKPCRTHMLHCGVVDVIIACLSRPDILEVTSIRDTVCSGTINNLLTDKDEVRDDMQARFRDANLGGLLCDILRQEQFMARPSTAYAVCRGIRAFAMWSSSDDMFVLEGLGACDLAVRAMGLHRDIPEVVSSACDVLLAVHYSQDEASLERLKAIGRAEDEEHAAATTAALEAIAAAAGAGATKEEEEEKISGADEPPPAPSAATETEAASDIVSANEVDTAAPTATTAEGDGDDGEFVPESVESITEKMREALQAAGKIGGGAPPPAAPPVYVSKRVVDMSGRAVSKSFEEMLEIWAPAELRGARGWTLPEKPATAADNSL
jgi:hypothetical protein